MKSRATPPSSDTEVVIMNIRGINYCANFSDFLLKVQLFMTGARFRGI